MWNIKSLRDFIKKCYLVQQLYENQADVALLNETMLTDKNSVFIRYYKIFRADKKETKGVATFIIKHLNETPSK